MNYRHINIRYKTRFWLIAWCVVAWAVFRHALFREVFWRVMPSVAKERSFERGTVEYFASVRFTSGRWFGRWHKPKKMHAGYSGFGL